MTSRLRPLYVSLPCAILGAGLGLLARQGIPWDRPTPPRATPPTAVVVGKPGSESSQQPPSPPAKDAPAQRKVSVAEIDAWLSDALADPRLRTRTLLDSLLTARASLQPADTVRLVHALAAKGLDVSLAPVLIGWARVDPNRAFGWLLEHANESAALAPKDFRAVIAALSQGESFFYSEDFVRRTVSDEASAQIPGALAKWNEAETRGPLVEQLRKQPEGDGLLKLMVLHFGRRGSVEAVGWLEGLAIAPEEKPLMVSALLREISANSDPMLAVEALRSASPALLPHDDAYAAVARGAASRDPVGAVVFANQISDLSSRSTILASAALQVAATASGDPDTVLTALPWPVGDARFIGIYGLVAAQMLATGRPNPAVAQFLTEARMLTPAQRALVAGNAGLSPGGQKP